MIYGSLDRGKIPTPAECGLPPKFDKWRTGQEDAINLMTTSPQRVVALCAPTGSGKSISAVTAALLSDIPTCIVTSSRALQRQYMDDFEEIGLVSLMGRANYECKMKPGYTCETGYAGGCPYKGTVACDCSRAEIKAAISTKVVTNYDKWMAAKRFGQGMSHFEQVIFDEAHNSVGAIARAMQTTFNSREIEDGLRVDFPKGSSADSVDTWKTWASLTRVVAEQAMQAALARITGVADPKQAWIKHYSHMRNLVRRLAILATAKASNWIVEQVEDGYQFDPVRIGQYAESTLLLRVPKIIMVSATLRPKTLFMCGISQSDFVFKEYLSDFNPARCPIYYIPTMRVDSRQPDLSLLWVKLDQIAAKRRDRKGIVHTVSYARQSEIAQKSRFFESMIINPKGEPTTETVEMFKAAGPGTILVSPSVGEGQDFVGDYARWGFLCKIPFEPPSRIVKAREADDPEYRMYQAAQSMEQIFGRNMRGKSDWCVAPETRILTSSLEWKPAGDLRCGEELMGFSEYPEKVDRAGKAIPRVWQFTRIVKLSHTQSERVIVHHIDGSLICTPDHPLLVQDERRVARWRAAGQLHGGDKIVKLANPWESPKSYREGWLAGFTDGEGSLQMYRHKDAKSPRTSLQGLYISQNEGTALTELELSLIRLNFDYGWNSYKKKCKVVKLKGGLPEIFRFLGQIRPVRLLENFKASSMQSRVLALSLPEVCRVARLTRGDIVRLATTTKTYVAEGLASHNCEDFICDEHLNWFLPRARHLVTRSFHRRFQCVGNVPAPIPIGGPQ